MHLEWYLNMTKPGWKPGRGNDGLPLTLWLRLVSPLPVCLLIVVVVRLCPSPPRHVFGHSLCVCTHYSMFSHEPWLRRPDGLNAEWMVTVHVNTTSTCSFALVPGSAAWVFSPFASLGLYKCCHDNQSFNATSIPLWKVKFSSRIYINSQYFDLNTFSMVRNPLHHDL